MLLSNSKESPAFRRGESQTEQTAYEHARIWAELEASGKMIGFYDLIVGATALERGSDVATFNKRHFGQISGLCVIEPK